MEKSSRPVRNRKRSRKVWPPGDIHRPIKRLFTPEIKRMLKDWLVRRRENPYPNREEKKQLAYETGLTYTQICNWFANWRRKLKNSGNDPIKKTWGNLIKNYNTNAKGNVEQFSICSEDSIWGENGDGSHSSRSPPPGGFSKRSYPAYSNGHHSSNNNNNSKAFVNYMKYMERRNSETSDDERPGAYPGNMFVDHCYTPNNYNAVFGLPGQPQCFQVTSTTEECHPDFNCNTNSIIAANFPNAYRAQNGTIYLTPSTTVSPSINHRSTSKYKNSIMEKYLRDLGEVDPADQEPPNGDYLMAPNPFQKLTAQSQLNIAPVGQMTGCEARGPPSLSKWLESTAKFTPSKNNYIDWDQPGRPSGSKKRYHSSSYQPSEQSPQPRSSSQPPQDTESSGEFGVHQKDEIDAAEALTRLANNFRMKFYT